MEALIVAGGKPLHGAVDIGGAKNAVLPILAATMLYGGTYEIHHCPNITDVSFAVEIISALGGRASRQGTTLLVDTSGVCRWQIPAFLMEKMRASVLFLGALLARFGKAELTMPGGCPLGQRPIDLHLNALTQLGAEITQSDREIFCSAPRLHGGTIILPFPSVGATENILLAATAGHGIVTLRGAAREPEITDLVKFLRGMGADIEGADGEWTVRGGAALRGTSHTVLPDRIEAATYLCGTAGCGGAIRLRGIHGQLLQPVLEMLESAGCRIGMEADEITLNAPQKLRSPGVVKTAPYPGFPTDAQALLMAALLRMEDSCCFTEEIFDRRFGHVPQMCRLGADIQVTGPSACVTGVKALKGTCLKGSDLRATAALVLAAMQAEGKSMIFGLKHLNRGYDNLEENLRRLGADIVHAQFHPMSNNTTGNFRSYVV